MKKTSETSHFSSITESLDSLSLDCDSDGTVESSSSSELSVLSSLFASRTAVERDHISDESSMLEDNPGITHYTYFFSKEHMKRIFYIQYSLYKHW